MIDPLIPHSALSNLMLILSLEHYFENMLFIKTWQIRKNSTFHSKNFLVKIITDCGK